MKENEPKPTMTEGERAWLERQEEIQGQSAAAWPESTVPGILFYDKDRLIYLAIQFTDDSLSLEQLRPIAQSIQVTNAQ